MPIYKTDEKKDGLTKYRVRVNYTDTNGKARSFTRVAYGIRAAKSLEKELSHGPVQQEITTDELYYEWMRLSEHELKRSSYRNRETYYNNYIRDYIGGQKLKSISTQMLTRWKADITQKSCSLTTKKNAYAYMRALLNFAVRMEYIDNNPLNKVANFKDPEYIKPEMDYYTPEEWQVFKETARAVAEERDYFDYYVFFCLAYYTGARKGEIQALRWDRLTGNRLQIKTSIYQKDKRGDIESTPKNKSSVRDIRISDNLLSVLYEHKKRQSKLPQWNESCYICGYDRPLRDTTIDKANRDIADRAGLKHIRIHDFRHSHASVLINAGINPLDVAHRLGHSTVEQTLKTYAHLFPKESEKALSVLENI